MTKQEFNTKVYNHLIELHYNEKDVEKLIKLYENFIDYCFNYYEGAKDNTEICAEGINVREKFLTNPEQCPILNHTSYNSYFEIRLVGRREFEKRKADIVG